MWIKICANTNLADALAAAELGADAVGFVFAPSKRQVTASQVREIVNGLPRDLEKVGVFSELTAALIAQIADIAKLTTLQLHGGWDAASTREVTLELTRLVPHLRLIQTAHWDLGDPLAGRNMQQLLIQMPTDARVLVDARVEGTSGGLGQTFDWPAATSVFVRPPADSTISSARLQQRLILAGGLTPDNVTQAIHLLQPYGVDVASGVEAAPGRKDYSKLRAFIENARKP